MSNSYLTNAARIAAAGKDQGLTQDEVVRSLQRTSQEKSRKAELREAAMARRVANEGAADFDFTGNDVPASLAGFNYGNGGEDIEFGVDQADWQVAQQDDKDIVARDRRRAEQAAKDIGIDQIMRGDNVIARNEVIKQLDRERKREQNPDGRTDWRMQGGSRIKEDPFLVGKRGPDENLLAAPEKQVRFMGRIDRDRQGNFLQIRHPHREVLERDPQFILGMNPGAQGDDQQRMEIEAERGQVRALRAQAAERERGIYREGDIRKAIRRAEIENNLGANVPGLAANRPFIGPLPDVDVEAMRAAIIQERINNPNRELNLPERIEFSSASPDENAMIRKEMIGRADGGQERFAERVLGNNVLAGQEADRILREGAFLEGQFGRIGNIRDIGNLKAKVPAKAGGFNEGQYFPVAAQDGIAPAFNAQGLPLGVQGPAVANLPNADNTLNAPRDARQWLIQNAPSYKDGGRIFGDFPQVDIGGVGNDFLARIGKIKAKGKAFAPEVSAIRNIDDLDAVVKQFGAFAKEGGLKMFQLDANKKEVFRDQVGLPEIFQKMKMNANGQGRLANAMFQLEAGKVNGVNAEQRALFERGLDQFGKRGRFEDVFIPNLVNGVSGVENIRNRQAEVQFGARLPEFGNDEAQLQKIPRGQIQIGVDAVGQPIKQEYMAALQGLQGNQAQPPLDANELRDARNGMVALVQGEGRGRNYGFAKPIPEGVSPRAFFKAQAVARAKPGRGPDIARVNANANQWQRIVDREKAARNAPNQVLGVVGDAEKALQAKGANFPVVEERKAPPEEFNGRWGYDQNLVNNPGEPRLINPDIGGRQMPSASSARAVAPSIAAAASPDPWQTPPATGGGFTEQERRVPASILNELAALNSGSTQGPRTPGIRQKIMNSIERAPINFATAPRRQRYGAALGAGLLGATGLSALIGGERDNRDQEVYQ